MTRTMMMLHWQLSAVLFVANLLLLGVAKAQDGGCEEIQHVKDIVIPVLPPSTVSLINVPGTCQWWARNWLGEQVNLTLFEDQELDWETRIQQRFAMAVLYCEMNGNEWRLPGNHTHNWLSDDHECDWTTVSGTQACDPIGRMRKIHLYSIQMRGTIPPELSILSRLEHLDLSDNLITGTIPADLHRLSDLTHVSLRSNHFQGQIPSVVWNWEDLVYLDLSLNVYLTGKIPNDVALKEPNLAHLFLSHNRLSGSIPTSFGQLHWKRLHLDNNRFEGPVPQQINSGFMREVLLHNNDLTGEFPASSFAREYIGPTSSLERVTLYGNQIQGDVNEMCTLLELHSLDEFAVDLNLVVCDCCTGPPGDDTASLEAWWGIAGWYQGCNFYVNECWNEGWFISRVEKVVQIDLTGQVLCYMNPVDPRGNYVHWFHKESDGALENVSIFTIVWPDPPSPSFVSSLLSCTPDGYCDCTGIEDIREGWRTSQALDSWCPSGYICDKKPFPDTSRNYRLRTVCEINSTITYTNATQGSETICVLNAAVKMSTEPPRDQSLLLPLTNTPFKCFEDKIEIQEAWQMYSEGSYAQVVEIYGPVQSWCLSNDITDLSGVFSYASMDERLDGWDTSNVANMAGLFENAYFFNIWRSADRDSGQYGRPIPTGIAAWNTSKVTNMTAMFSFGSFNEPINSWDVSSVEMMDGMFYGNENFKQDLCKWGSSLRPTASVVGMFDHIPCFTVYLRCPSRLDPNLTATPPGPFCFVCNQTSLPPTNAPTPPQRLEPTTRPTSSPTTLVPTTSPSGTPTVSPSTGMPSALPTELETTVFVLQGLTIRIEGARELDLDSRRVFKEETERFYKSINRPQPRRRPGRYLVETSDLVFADVTVTTTSEILDALGITIRYDLSIHVTTRDGASSEEVDEEIVRQAVREPFESQEQREAYTALLRDKDADGGFASVTSVGTPMFADDPMDSVSGNDDDDDDDGGLGVALLLLLIVAPLLACCCFIGMVVAYYYRNRPQGGLLSLGAPEQPIDRFKHHQEDNSSSRFEDD